MVAPVDVTQFLGLAEQFLGHPPEVGSPEGRREFFRAISQWFALLAGDLADELLTTRDIAELTGRDPETIRVWCRRKRLGRFDAQMGRYVVPLSDLLLFWTNNIGGPDTMPAELRQRMEHYLGAPKRPSVLGPSHAAAARPR